MIPVLVDSNVILDVTEPGSPFHLSSSDAIEHLGERTLLVINAVVYAEVSVRFDRVEDVDSAVPPHLFRREAIPWDAAFLAGKCFLEYRRRGGRRSAPLPDFFIGAHATVRRYRLLTRDRGRYRTYFPTLELIAPNGS